MFAVSTAIGWICSGQLSTSRRVGIQRQQKYDLIQSGIYAYIRNPYFVTYLMMFGGFFLVRPSLFGLLLAAITSAIFIGWY